MAGIRWAKAYPLVVGLSVAAAVLPTSSQAADSLAATSANCSFRQDPDAFLGRQSRAIQDAFERTKKLTARTAGVAAIQDPAAIARVNFIDDEIFTRLQKEGVKAAAMSTDQEFLRRVSLDLTGRVPTPQQVKDFVASTDPNKREAAIARLLWSPEFTDRWTMWMGDLLQNVGTTPSTANINPQQTGRNAFYNWIRAAVDSDMSIRDMAQQLIGATTATPPTTNVTTMTTTGTTWETQGGHANFILTAGTAGGPIQDSYDMALVKSATTFLGMGHYDCLLCHNGRGHLDALSLWAKDMRRQDAEATAAFFSRWRNTVQNTTATGNPNNRPNYVYDVATGQYDLNTTSGNRPNRLPYGDNGTIKNLTPLYRDGTAAPDANWRKAIASKMANDPMFARNFANRLWKQMFNLALVEPVDTLDPARLDPNNPPPDGWDFQASHPVLLEALAAEFKRGNFSLRSFLHTIVSSNAYQLSSHYDGDWSLAYVQLYARHIPRRLEGEEIHDQISLATQNFNKYTVFEWGDTTVSLAMQLPESVEPRSNGAAATFMNNFYRGNRDTTKRLQDGSILQQLAMMNDSFVINRIKVTANSPAMVAMSKLTDPAQLSEQMFLTFLGRYPTDGEVAKVKASWAKATTAQNKTDLIQDLAWSCINKIEFLFSY